MRPQTALAIAAWLAVARAKTYSRCGLARELRFLYGLPEWQVPTWVCIARFESIFNTSAVGRLNGGHSLDHGLFQVSDTYWCSPPGRGWACGLSCDKLEDDDISDDVACALRIYREHQRLSGDGFNAWVVYQRYCSRGRADHYVDDCFETPVSDNVIDEQTSSPLDTPSTSPTPTTRPATTTTTTPTKSTSEMPL